MTFSIVLSVLVGFALLLIGSHFLVQGASRLAQVAGVSSLIIGLTVVAYCTSAPEMFVSTVAAFSGNTEIALGNVVGSNIFNVLLTLGISALVIPLTVAKQLIRFDVPVMIIVSSLLYLLVTDGTFGRIDGFILFTVGILYTVALIRIATKDKKETPKDIQPISPHSTKKTVLLSLLGVGLGLVLLVLGSKFLVHGAVEIATNLGVSELIIGLTIVAVGTSIPELVTSIVAAIQGERDIAIGNIVGSNIFNICAVLGLSGILSPEVLTLSPELLSTDLPIMLITAMLCFPFFMSGFRLNRIEGTFFLILYAVYTWYLVTSALGTEEEISKILRYGLLILPTLVCIVNTIFILFTEKKRVRQ